MIDLKILGSALTQLEEDKGIPREKIMGAIEDALAAAYKKEYGKRGQIIRAKFDLSTGSVAFERVKIVVDKSIIREDDEPADLDDDKVKFNEEYHIWLNDAKKIKQGALPHDEIVFPLEAKDDYGRIAAQTAKQVIMQRLRDAERVSVLDEYTPKEGDIISGNVQRLERGNVFVDLGRVTAILPKEEQIAGEYYRQGERIRGLLLSVNESARGVDMKLSRAHPDFLVKLFAIESPEVASGTVIIKAIAREAGSRSKLSVISTDENIDPVGSLVGQRGIRVNTVINELGGEKIDIMEWSEEPEQAIAQALSPAHVQEVQINEDEQSAKVLVDADQFSLAIGRGGQNVRLAAKLTGWKIDIAAPTGEQVSQVPDGKTEGLDSETDKNTNTGDGDNLEPEEHGNDEHKESGAEENEDKTNDNQTGV